VHKTRYDANERQKIVLPLAKKTTTLFVIADDDSVDFEIWYMLSTTTRLCRITNSLTALKRVTLVVRLSNY